MSSEKFVHEPDAMNLELQCDPQRELAILDGRMAELRARGILRGGNPDAPRPPITPARPPVRPGALKRFLKHRG